MSPNVRAIAASLTSAGLLLAWSLWRALGDAASQFSSARITASIAASDLWDTPFRSEAIEFSLALLGLHLAFAALIWGASRLAVVANPRLDARIDSVALAIGALAIAWVLVANAQWYPWSRWVPEARWLDFGLGVNFSTYHLLTVLLGGAVIAIATGAIARSGRYRRFWIRAVVYSSTAAVGLWLWNFTALVAEEFDASATRRPHVILIGIDSLRPDVAGLGQRVGLTPNLDRFASEANIFADAITPLARTFPAWVSILTGSHPVQTGARENLVSRDSLSLPPTLPELLRAQGYRTYYGTDEVRFSNIDEDYGFDEVIGPRMGASDFLLAPISDLPLVNLVVNTAVGRWLFPNSYVNRAAAVTYKPETFVHELDRRLDFSQPAFVAIHLALPHWPYHWGGSDDELFSDTRSQAYGYAAAVLEVDRQFGELMANLERKGALNNAIVVVLSDHGEALGLPGDNLIHGNSSMRGSEPLIVNSRGHGNSVLSPSQYAVFLAFRSYGGHFISPANRARLLETPATLEDIVPTLLAAVDIDDQQPRDGMSLLPLLRGDDSLARPFESRLRFTETGIMVGFSRSGQVDELRLASEHLHLFTVNAATSRIELDPGYMPALLRARERAVISRTRLLAAIPGASAGAQHYLVVDRAGGVPRMLGNAPSLDDDPELNRMWGALFERFGAEVAAEPPR